METKGALQSLGVWGSVIALLPILDQALAVLGLAEQGLIPEVANGLMTVGGTLMGLWGRIRAKTKISGLFG